MEKGIGNEGGRRRNVLKKGEWNGGSELGMTER